MIKASISAANITRIVRDALIVAAAAKAGAKRLLSEDLNAGQTIAGVRIESPFIA